MRQETSKHSAILDKYEVMLEGQACSYNAPISQTRRPSRSLRPEYPNSPRPKAEPTLPLDHHQ